MATDKDKELFNNAEQSVKNDQIKQEVQNPPNPNETYDFLGSYVRAQKVNATQAYAPVSTYDVHKVNQFKTPFIPSKEKAFKQISEELETTDPNVINSVYQQAQKEAYNISIKKFADESRWYLNHIEMPFESTNLGGRVPLAQAEILDKAIDIETPGLPSAQMLTDQQKTEAAGYYKDKEGNYKFLSEWRGDSAFGGETVLAQDPYNNENIWNEYDKTKFVNKSNLRSIWGPSEWETNPLISTAKGFTSGLVGSLVTGLGQGIAAYGKSMLYPTVNGLEAYGLKKKDVPFLNDSMNFLDAMGNRASNFANRVWSENEDEKEGMFSGDPSAFMYGFSNILGQLTQTWALAGGGAIASKTLGASDAVASNIAKMSGSASSGLIMAGMSYEEGKAAGIDDEWAALIASASGLAGAFIESRGLNLIMDAGGARVAQAENKEMIRELAMEISGLPKTDAAKQKIAEKVFEKMARMSDKVRTQRGVSGALMRGAATGLEEGTEEFLQGFTDDLLKNTYNSIKSSVDENEAKKYQEQVTSINKDINRYSRVFSDDGTTKYTRDGIEIPKETFLKEYGSLVSSKKLLEAQNISFAEKGQGLYNTGWNKMFSQGEESAGGFLGGFTAGMFTKGGRKRSLINAALEGKLNDAKDALDDVYSKEGLAPKNISSVNGQIFSEDNPESEENPSLNAVAYKQAMQEFSLIEELMNTDLKKLNPETFKGTKDDRDTVTNIISQRIQASEALKVKENELASVEDDQERTKVQSEIDAIKNGIDTLNDRFQYYTNPQYKGKIYDDAGEIIGEIDNSDNQTPYTEPFRNLVKQNAILNSFGDTRSTIKPGVVSELFSAVKQHNIVQQELVKQKQAERKQFIEETDKSIEGITEPTSSYESKIAKVSDYIKKISTTGGLSPKQTNKVNSFMQGMKDDLKNFSAEFTDKYIKEELFGARTQDISDMTFEEFKKKLESKDESLLPTLENVEEDFDTVGNNIEDYTNRKLQEFQGVIDNIVPISENDQQIPDFTPVNVGDFFDRYESRVSDLEKLAPEELSSDERKQQILDTLKELTNYGTAFQVTEAYDKLKQGNLDSESITELNKITSGLPPKFHIKNDPEVKQHTIFSKEERQAVNDKISKYMDRLKNSFIRSEEESNSIPNRDIEFKKHDIKSKKYILTSVLSMSTDNKSVAELLAKLNSQEFENSMNILSDSNQPIESREDARIFVSNEMTYIESQIFQNKIVNKKVYERIADELIKRNSFSGTTFFSNLSEFSNIDYFNALSTGIIYQDVDKNKNSSILSFRMLYTMNYLNSIREMDNVRFSDDLKVLIKNAKSEVPTYEQIQVLKDVVSILGSGITDLHKYMISKMYVGNMAEEQSKVALDHLINNSVMTRGFAGTGKTTVAGRYAINLYSSIFNKSFDVYGVAPALKQIAGVNLAIDNVVNSDQNARIKKGNVSLANGLTNLLNEVKNDTVLLIDEASLLSGKNLDELKNSNKNLKIIFMGDESQSIESSSAGVIPKVFKYSLRTMPLTQVFRTGVLKLWELQTELRKYTVGTLQNTKKITFPSSSFFSKDGNKLGLEYSLTEQSLINSWLNHAQTLGNSDAVLVVNSEIKREEIIKQYKSQLGESIADMVYTIEGEQFRIQGLEKPFVYSTVQATGDTQAAYKNSAKDVLTVATRAEKYLNLLVSDPTANPGKNQVSSENEIAVVREKSDTEKADFIVKQKELFLKEYDTFYSTYRGYASKQPKEVVTQEKTTETRPLTIEETVKDENITYTEGSVPVNYKNLAANISDNILNLDGGPTNVFLGNSNVGTVYFRNDNGKIKFTTDALNWKALNATNLKTSNIQSVGNIELNPMDKIVNSINQFENIVAGSLWSQNDEVLEVENIFEIISLGNKEVNVQLSNGTLVNIVDFKANYTKHTGFSEKAKLSNQNEGTELFSNGEIPVTSRVIAITGNTKYNLSEIQRDKSKLMKFLMDNNFVINLKFDKLLSVDPNLKLVNQNALGAETELTSLNYTVGYLDKANVLNRLVAKGQKSKEYIDIIQKYFGDTNAIIVTGMYANDLSKYGMKDLSSLSEYKAQDIINTAKSVGTIEAISKGKWHLFQLFSQLYPNKDIFAKRLTVKRNGNLTVSNKNIRTLSDFIGANNFYYEFKGVVQKALNDKTETVALFQNKLNPALPLTEIYLKSIPADNKYINKLSFPTVKDGDKVSNLHQYYEIEKSDAFQFIKYNSALLLADERFAGLIEANSRGKLEIVKNKPSDYVQQAKAVITLMAENPGLYYQNPVSINKQDKTRIEINTENITDNFNTQSKFNIIQDPLFVVEANTDEAIDLSKRDIYKSFTSQLDAIQVNPQSEVPERNSKLRKGLGDNFSKIKEDTGSDLEYESIADIEDFIDELLGTTGTENLQFRSNIFSKEGLPLHGMVSSGKIIIENNGDKASRKVAAHEVLHFVNNYIITDRERNSLYNGVKNIYGAVDAEEWLANGIESYDTNTKTFTAITDKTLPGKIKAFFEMLRKFFFGIETSEDIIKNHYDDILAGKYRNMPINSDENFKDEYTKVKPFSDKTLVYEDFGGEVNFRKMVFHVRKLVFDRSNYNRNLDTYQEHKSNIADIIADLKSEFEAEAAAISLYETVDLKLEDGSILNKPVKEIQNNEIKYLNDNVDAMFDVLIDRLVSKNNFEYVMQEVLPQYIITKNVSLDSSKRSDNTLGNENSLRDGIGEISAQYKFIIKTLKTKSGELIHEPR
jgi:hypothetical protein